MNPVLSNGEAALQHSHNLGQIQHKRSGKNKQKKVIIIKKA